jgi:hypothetical protein
MPLREDNPNGTIQINSTEFNTRNVNSSNVSWVGWPKSGEPLMVVMYRAGTIYGYIGVSRQKVVAAARARSTGEYINKRIKPHHRMVLLGS